jgi:3-isopropylmalate dehydrogenase
VGAILSAALLLRHSLQMGNEAEAVERAVDSAIADGFRTPDIRGSNSTEEVTGGIVKRITLS